MRKTLLTLALLPVLGGTLAYSQDIDNQSNAGVTAASEERASLRERLSEHLFYLASDSLKGRRAGSEDALKAAEYIQKQYEEIGLKPFFKDFKNYFIHDGKDGLSDREDILGDLSGYFVDIVGVIEGSDPVLKNEYIVLGAHYDHLGVEDGKIYNGADDNASGSSALIEIARELYAHRSELKRSVIIAAFDAEELGLYGSVALSHELSMENLIDKVKLMMSIDMVGWYRASGKLTLEGVATIRNGRRILESEAEAVSIVIDPERFEKSILTATDTEEFAKFGVPTLSVSTGLKSPYHKPEDDPELIDYDGLAKVSDYISAITLKVASDPSFKASGKIARKHIDKVPVVEAGLTVAWKQSMLDFRKSSLVGRYGSGVSAGPQFQLNVKSFALNAKVLYELSTCKFPDDSDLFGSKLKYRQQAVSVPVTLLWQYPSYLFRLYLGFGGYYDYVFDDNSSSMTLGGSPFSVNQDQYGFLFTLGVQSGPWSLSVTGRRQLNNFFIDGPSRTRLASTYITFGYSF